MQILSDIKSESLTQTQVVRSMTMEQRWNVAQNLYATAREWKTCSLRTLHPEWNESAIKDAVRRSFSHA